MPPPDRPHLALRPLWLCRTCGAPWPCPEARLTLVGEYATDPVGLSVYLCGVLHETTADLHRLHPDHRLDPAALFDRFLGWARRRATP
ncbi:hypothetical protein O7598_01340 [Micromonospora sp. WMMC241]|uniref:hypothetical protein n=1 Tax=Micromonospora sp. WMMC241 TaxID=3015159 RepID=UPI0022B63C0E|nr:hypothetical protein [Micromonospora sp. WMMC241]MCZ7435026.1 hypothetical protein [Micromonospora sp. WMMC241]